MPSKDAKQQAHLQGPQKPVCWDTFVSANCMPVGTQYASPCIDPNFVIYICMHISKTSGKNSIHTETYYSNITHVLTSNVSLQV